MKESIKDIINLFRMQMKESKLTFVFLLIYGFTNAFRTFPQIIFPTIIINLVLQDGSLNKLLLILSAFSIITFLLNFVLTFISTVQTAYNLKLPHALNLMLAIKSVKVDYADIEQTKTIDNYNRAGEMIFQVSASCYMILMNLITSSVKLIVLIYVVSTLDYIVVFILIGIVILNYSISLKSGKKNHEFDMRKNTPNRQADYAIKMTIDREFSKDARLYNATSFIMDKYNDANEIILDVEKKKQKYNMRTDFIRLSLNSAQTLLIYLVMIYRYALNDLTIGSFTLYLSSANEFYNTISSIFSVLSDLKKVSMYFNEYKKFMNISENMRMTKKDGVFINCKKSPLIEFRNVYFKYPNQNDFALKDINLKIYSDEKILIMGENGAGKTTFIKLLIRLYDVTDGQIIVNGRNIKDYDYDEYMSLFSPVFQDCKLFAYTIKENICFDRPDDSKLKESLQNAGAWSLIQNLPNKENTFLKKEFEESSVELSGGEMQRIAIARAIYKNAPIVILDEPMASIDPLAEFNIYKSFEKLTKEKTSIYISHRLASVKYCNRILVFDKGQIVEDGSHHQLIHKNGLYANTYRKQSEYYV